MAKPQRPIIAVNVFPDVDMLRDHHFGPSVSGWQAIAGRLNPLARRESAPFIFESLVRVPALNGVCQAKTQRGFADVYIRPPVELYNILDFGAYRQIADIGYRSAMEHLGVGTAQAPQRVGTEQAQRGPALERRAGMRSPLPCGRRSQSSNNCSKAWIRETPLRELSGANRAVRSGSYTARSGSMNTRADGFGIMRSIRP